MLDRLDSDTDRPGLDLTKPDYWANRIEPGTFSMGDTNGVYDEKPQFDYTIRRPYALARFPVTNRQYLLFVEALVGRGTPEAVAAANRLKDLMKQHGETPETYNGFRPYFWPGARYRAGEGNHPVVGVTWYAATAFAWWADAWLHALGVLKEGEEVRLPTEAEWERAAAYPVETPGTLRYAPPLRSGATQGADPDGSPPSLRSDQGALSLRPGSGRGRPQAVSKGVGGAARAPSTGSRQARREYPWGAELTTATSGSMIASIQANIDESKISGTSVVGIFPHGAAACGAEELAGNVWEWCSTPYLEYPFKDEVIAESLYTKNKRAGRTCVLRGGSWYLLRGNARCAYRLFLPADLGVVDHGFRLARLFSSC
jgi:formylglycine-generating enzyme required for sulfatase activity